jgi:hypothetical protein
MGDVHLRSDAVTPALLSLSQRFAVRQSTKMTEANPIDAIDAKRLNPYRARQHEFEKHEKQTETEEMAR